MAERRVLTRIPVDADVTLRKSSTGEVCSGSVANIHVQGICIACNERFEPGELIELEVIGRSDRQRGTSGPLTATLRVLRVEGDEPPFEVAGEFLAVNLP